jgi:hypothetical protein
MCVPERVGVVVARAYLKVGASTPCCCCCCSLLLLLLLQDGKAEAAVSQMMKKCFRDTDPFPRVPGL